MSKNFLSSCKRTCDTKWKLNCQRSYDTIYTLRCKRTYDIYQLRPTVIAAIILLSVSTPTAGVSTGINRIMGVYVGLEAAGSVFFSIQSGGRVSVRSIPSNLATVVF